jgi:hypothetical protein
MWSMRRVLGLCSLAAALWLLPAVAARGFGTYGHDLSDDLRWDAAPRILYGAERSLDGGLRYSLEGGSYEAFRDTFTWNVTPSVAVFQTVVERAFAQWTFTDPASGLGSNLAFVADFATPVAGGYGGGAEIDVYGYTINNLGETGFDARDDLRRHHAHQRDHGYGGVAIAGADITLSTRVTWTTQSFQTVLAHEIGHALGLADVDLYSGPGGIFIDDNYDGSTRATAKATLMNSFAALIDPYDPASSPLNFYYVANGDPGFDTIGVYMLMESEGALALANDSIKLQADDFAGRQFLYPWVPVPEPAALPLVALGLAAIAAQPARNGPPTLAATPSSSWREASSRRCVTDASIVASGSGAFGSNAKRPAVAFTSATAASKPTWLFVSAWIGLPPRSQSRPGLVSESIRTRPVFRPISRIWSTANGGISRGRRGTPPRRRCARTGPSAPSRRADRGHPRPGRT